MLVVFKGIKEDNILVFDAEYNTGDLIQFAGILFKKVQKDIFQISKSVNIYVKLENSSINRFIKAFTGITDEFLEENGVSLLEAKEEIEKFLEHKGTIIFVSHGLYNDRQILLDNEIDFYGEDEEKLPGICTYKMAQKVLKRQNKLSLTDVAAEAGVFLSNTHNAFDDTWATIAVLSLLCKLEEEEKDDDNKNI
jgi:DNA polymerase III alpha subunit (gram-positive type)